MKVCPKCGRRSGSEELYCAGCGTSLASLPPEPTYGPPPPLGPAMRGERPPNNHLTKAIIATVLCCLPLGVAAIVQAASVNGKFFAGDLAGAESAARSASTLANWSIGVGLAGSLLYVALMLAGIMSEPSAFL
jgi:hypothetical protein